MVGSKLSLCYIDRRNSMPSSATATEEASCQSDLNKKSLSLLRPTVGKTKKSLSAHVVWYGSICSEGSTCLEKLSIDNFFNSLSTKLKVNHKSTRLLSICRFLECLWEALAVVSSFCFADYLVGKLRSRGTRFHHKRQDARSLHMVPLCASSLESQVSGCSTKMLFTLTVHKKISCIHDLIMDKGSSPRFGWVNILSHCAWCMTSTG